MDFYPAALASRIKIHILIKKQNIRPYITPRYVTQRNLKKLLYACLTGPRAGIREPLNLKSNRYEKEKLHAADCRGAQTERRKRIRRFHAARNRRLGQ